MVRVKGRVRGWVRVRVRGGDYFLRLHTQLFYSRLGQIAIFLGSGQGQG